MNKLGNFAKNLFLLLVPVMVTTIGLLRANGVEWASHLATAFAGTAVAYLLVCAPNTVAFAAVSGLPLALIGLGLYGIYLWNYDWLFTVCIAFAIRALWPVATSKQLYELCGELKIKSKEENRFIINKLEWLLGDGGKRGK